MKQGNWIVTDREQEMEAAEIFPFAITPGIRDAYAAHQDFCSSGSDWLICNDPDGQTEQELIDHIRELVECEADKHFGDDQDAWQDFWDQVLCDTDTWWNMLEQSMMPQELETAQ